MNNSINTDRPDFEAIVKKATWKSSHGSIGMEVVSSDRCEELLEHTYKQAIEPLLSTVKRLQKELSESYYKGCTDTFNNHVKPALQRAKRLQEENEQLKAWKDSEMALWSPLLDFFQKEDKLIKLGQSISEEALRRSKAFVELQEVLREATSVLTFQISFELGRISTNPYVINKHLSEHVLLSKMRSLSC